jgi:hypothetical protein
MKDSAYLNMQQAAMLIENGGVDDYGQNRELAVSSAAARGLVVVRFMKGCCVHYAACSADALGRVTGRTAAAAVRGFNPGAQ